MARNERGQAPASRRSKDETISCGIVMPISRIGDCSEGHWTDVLNIISEAVSEVGFYARLVSNADEVTVIQKTIVQNLYNEPVVVCDVSEKNPNVMFELGMRLAFDKPTVVIKDDKTSFSFDTGVIEHLEYPRDLRFGSIVEFKRRLGEKVLATHDRSVVDPSYSTFLGHFGTFKVASLEQKEVSGQEFIIEQLSQLQKQVDSVKSTMRPYGRPLNYPAGTEMDICCGPMNESEVDAFVVRLASEKGIPSVRRVNVDGHTHLFASGDFESAGERMKQERKLQELAKQFRAESRARRLGERTLSPPKDDKSNDS